MLHVAVPVVTGREAPPTRALSGGLEDRTHRPGERSSDAAEPAASVWTIDTGRMGLSGLLFEDNRHGRIGVA
jgi:hypothetical protein